MSLKSRLDRLEADATDCWLQRHVGMDAQRVSELRRQGALRSDDLDLKALTDAELEALVMDGPDGDVLWAASDAELQGIVDGDLDIVDGEIVPRR